MPRRPDDGTTPAPRVPPGLRLVDIEELEVEVEKLVAGGDGLARFAGVPIFIPRSAPGDRLRVRLVERRPDYGRAEIVEILSPGAGRRVPPCPYFTRCGGCDLQHLEEPLQLRLKVAAVRETLERLGRLTLPAELEVISGAAWGYRQRTQVHTAVRAGQVEVGYFARGSHELVAVDRCPVLVPELEELLPNLARRLDPASAPRRLDLAAGEGGELSSAPVVEGLPRGTVELEVDGLRYRYDARCFFQTHRGLVGQLVERAVGGWSGETACDLYAGVGLFALPLARRYARVLAVEGEGAAARYARQNARHNHLTNVEVAGFAVEGWISRLPEAVDRVLVDPPRTGLTGPVRAALKQKVPRRLTYVSCHAATLARDLRELAAAYRLESLVLIDLFPQTGHMEAVVQLEAR